MGGFTVEMCVSECSVSVDDFGSSSPDEFHSYSLSDSNGNGSTVLKPDLVVIVDVDSLTSHLYRPLLDPDELAQLPESLSVSREHDVAHQRLVADYFAEQPRWGPMFREDNIGRLGLTPLQKCTVAIRQLAYGTTEDMFDEYLHVGETTVRDCLKNFFRGVVEAFGDTYLRRPTADDCQNLMRMHEMVHDFPGMLRSIDFGSNNDINVLNSSTLFADQYRGRGTAIEFTANGRQYLMGYYLDYGIYPRWPVFVKTVSFPMGDRRVLFAAKQEAARKDVERDFVEQEVGHVTDWADDEGGSSSSTGTTPVARGLLMDFSEVLARQTSMRSQQDHAALMNDMIEEVWKRHDH
ncbi:uncharacterized protein LOC125220419 [Salvia hispanica]|uniref:uncharacterized protein LOC125220419 n=1 Tax=Salvia hispanica TaxID=49212 RepID=UPI0020094846|nr:uncharacterized protein LOC125220419 [Salvia hispanica]